MASDWFKKVGKVIAVTAEATAEVVRDTAVSTAEAVRTTAGVGVGSIAFDVSQVDYKPGDKVEGTVRLTLEEPTAADKLVVRLYATGTRTRYERESGSSSKTLVHEKETLYSFDLEVDGEKTYPAGENSYEFSIRIPVDTENEGSLPESGILSEIVKVASLFSRGAKHPTTWTLRTFLNIPWKRNLKKELAIQVMPSGDA
jgi:hypothetical protein